jgi:hypothetical protein
LRDSESGFRQLKDLDPVAVQPMFHWTNQKITVHLFTCVLALMVIRRLDEPAVLPAASKESPPAGEDSPVDRLPRWAVDLASEHRHLLAQHDDLDREVGLLTTGEPDQLEDATERPVEEREGHRRKLAASGADVEVQLTAHGSRSRHPQV